MTPKRPLAVFLLGAFRFVLFLRKGGGGEPSKPLLLRLSLVELEFQTELKTFETSDAVGQDIIKKKKMTMKILMYCCYFD